MALNSNKPTFIITAALWVLEGQRDLFDQYENRAVSIMARYGGRLLSAMIVQDSTTENPPNEFHVLEFPNEEAFHRYRSDSDLVSLTELRQECIKHTEIHSGILSTTIK